MLQYNGGEGLHLVSASLFGLRCIPDQTMPVFHTFPSPHHPQESSDFGSIPSDVTQLILVHLDFPFLVMLKCLRRNVANACRRTLRSAAYLECIYSDNHYDHMQNSIFASRLAFPFQTFIPTNDYKKRDTDNVWEINETIAPRDTLIFHKLDIQFYYEHKRIDHAKAVLLYEKILNEEDLEKTLHVVCGNVCIERPTVGIYHSFDGLLNDLSESKEFDIDHTKLLDLPPELNRNLVGSVQRKDHVMEMLYWTRPFVQIGKSTFRFRTDLGLNIFEECMFGYSVLELCLGKALE